MSIFGWLKKATEVKPDPLKEHLKSFTNGSTCYLSGIPCTVINNGIEAWWDDEHEIPFIRVSYMNDLGEYTRVKLLP